MNTVYWVTIQEVGKVEKWRFLVTRSPCHWYKVFCYFLVFLFVVSYFDARPRVPVNFLEPSGILWVLGSLSSKGQT